MFWRRVITFASQAFRQGILSIPGIVLLPLPLFLAIAEATPPADQVFDPDLYTKGIGQVIGISKDERFMARLKAKLIAVKSQRAGSPEKEETVSVVRHLRSTNGAPLAKAAEVAPPNSKGEIEKLRQKRAQNPRERSAQARKAGYTKLLTPPELQSCAKGETVKQKNSTPFPSDSSRIRFDILYLKSDAREIVDPRSSFGEKITTHVYTTNKADLLSLKATHHGAPCLPFRIRVTDKFVYFHMGADALRNFDRHPDGKGVVTDEIKPLLDRFL